MRRFCVRLPLIYIRGPYFRSIMTSLMSQGSRARTRRRVETGFGWLAVTVDKSSVSFRIARSIEAWIREGRAVSAQFTSAFNIYDIRLTFNTPQSTTRTTLL